MFKSISFLLIAFLLTACSININKTKDSGIQKPNMQQTSAIYLEKIELASGYSIVIAEGPLEPRSIGSITVRLYRDLMVGDFVTAISFSRDGTVLKSLLIENGSDKQKLSITTVTAGSGNYQANQFICIQDDKMMLC